jgi:hypothetical protein
MNRRMPNGTYGGVRGGGREAPTYSIVIAGKGSHKRQESTKNINVPKSHP